SGTSTRRTSGRDAARCRPNGARASRWERIDEPRGRQIAGRQVARRQVAQVARRQGTGREAPGSSMNTLLLAQIVLTLIVFVALLSSAAAMVYVERKVAAFIQQRIGPYLVGPKGLLQPLADVVKLMFKEELRPRAADALLFALAPIISATCAFAAFAV